MACPSQYMEFVSWDFALIYFIKSATVIPTTVKKQNKTNVTIQLVFLPCSDLYFYFSSLGQTGRPPVTMTSPTAMQAPPGWLSLVFWVHVSASDISCVFAIRSNDDTIERYSFFLFGWLILPTAHLLNRPFRRRNAVAERCHDDAATKSRHLAFDSIRLWSLLTNFIVQAEAKERCHSSKQPVPRATKRLLIRIDIRRFLFVAKILSLTVSSLLKVAGKAQSNQKVSRQMFPNSLFVVFIR